MDRIAVPQSREGLTGGGGIWEDKMEVGREGLVGVFFTGLTRWTGFTGGGVFDCLDCLDGLDINGWAMGCVHELDD